MRDELKMQWNAIAIRIGVAPTTAIPLYGCHSDVGAELRSPALDHRHASPPVSPNSANSTTKTSTSIGAVPAW